MSADPKDLIEASKILMNESRLLTEKRHLIAVAEDAAIARARVTQMGAVIEALFVQFKLEEITVTAAYLAQAAETRYVIAVDPQADGSIVVKRFETGTVARGPVLVQ